ncbi:MAG: RIP metalloprotease RseP [Candidatus Omnitrophica bacterium]|nr:RIP metalloprotease RseP [Candidatus Omnitrophota bacterium]
MAILGILIVFSIVIFVHEFGHFWTAKKLGINVERFSFGFGPAIFSWKRGETEYAICPILFGGYVKLAGEEGVSKGTPDEYSSKPPGYRALVLFSGAFNNLVVGYLFIIPALIFGIVTYNGTKIGGLIKGYPAEKAGLKSGDRIISIDGKKTTQWLDILLFVTKESNKYPGKPLDIQVKRNNGIKTFYIKPYFYKTGKSILRGEKRYIIGILPQEKTVKYNFFKAIPKAFYYYVDMLKKIVISLQLLITGQVGINELSGPVGIAKLSGEAISLGFATFCYFLAFININLGVFNLLPYPVLDGGHIAGVLGEKILRRKPNKKFLEIINTVAAISIIMFALYITYFDILRIIK